VCTSGACVTGSSGGAALGDACTANADCAGNLCLKQGTAVTATTWPGGYCSKACTADADCGKDAQGNLLGYCNASGACLKACSATTGQSNCRSGYVCDLGWIASARTTAKTCVWKCISNSDCGGGSICDSGVAAGYCAGGATYRCIGQGYAATPTCLSGATCKANGYCP